MTYRRSSLVGLFSLVSLVACDSGGGTTLPSDAGSMPGACECSGVEQCDSVDNVCRPSCESTACTGDSACVVWGRGGADGDPVAICRPHPGTGTGEETGETYTYVWNAFDFGIPLDSTTSAGLDLDGRVSDMTDATACRQVDMTSPAPFSEPGVDNALGVLLQAFGGVMSLSSDARAAINEGAFLLIVEVSGVDDLVNDPSVRVRFVLGTLDGTGATLPMVGGDDMLVPGQTFNVLASSLGMYDARGEIVDGVVSAGPTDFTLTLESGGDSYTLVFESAIVRFFIDADGMEDGVLAGEMSAENLILTLMSASDTLTEELLRTVVTPRTDLRPTARGDGEYVCSHLSSVLVFGATTAVRGDDV